MNIPHPIVLGFIGKKQQWDTKLPKRKRKVQAFDEKTLAMFHPIAVSAKRSYEWLQNNFIEKQKQKKNKTKKQPICFRSIQHISYNYGFPPFQRSPVSLVPLLVIMLIHQAMVFQALSVAYILVDLCYNKDCFYADELNWALESH